MGQSGTREQGTIRAGIDVPGFAALSVSVEVASDGTLPTEFRLFAAGVNETEKGPLVFDDAAAARVMAAFAAHGVDVQIDLEHLSVAAELVSGDARNFDPDARGWCQLELRGGELWAVGVSWTDDGAERLRSRRQRYVSPVVRFDADRRITKIVNIALTGLPATHEAMALVASVERGNMERTEVLAGSSGKAAAVKESAIEASDSLAALGKAFKGSDIDATFAAIEAAKAAVEAFSKACDALTSGAKADEPGESEGEEAPTEDPALQMRTGDGAAELLSVTGKATIGEALAVVSAWRDSHRQAAEDNAKMAAELAAKAELRRVELLAESIGLGYESPATAWADPDGRTPKAEFLSMPLEALEARVAVQRENPRAFQSATAVRGSVSSSLLELARKRGADPERVAAVRAQFRTVRGGQS
jgi:hypothetical protein